MDTQYPQEEVSRGWRGVTLEGPEGGTLGTLEGLEEDLETAKTEEARGEGEGHSLILLWLWGT